MSEMHAPITALYAALCGFLILILAFLAVRQRMKGGVLLGDGGQEAMQRAMRVMANASEYIPIMLFLMLLLEINGANAKNMHAAGIAILLGRGLHAWGFSRSSGTSSGRFNGTLITWMAIFVMSIANILSFIQHLN